MTYTPTLTWAGNVCRNMRIREEIEQAWHRGGASHTAALYAAGMTYPDSNAAFLTAGAGLDNCAADAWAYEAARSDRRAALRPQLGDLAELFA